MIKKEVKLKIAPKKITMLPPITWAREGNSKNPTVPENEKKTWGLQTIF
jgi:hypothetical protein